MVDVNKSGTLADLIQNGFFDIRRNHIEIGFSDDDHITILQLVQSVFFDCLMFFLFDRQRISFAGVFIPGRIFLE